MTTSHEQTAAAEGGRRPGGPPTVLVVGLGSLDRGDDTVGPTVARRLATLGLPVRVVEHEDPTALIDLWQDADLAVVVDAVRTGAVPPPGAPDVGADPARLLVLECGAEAGPLPESAWARTGRGGTHAFGLAAAVELSRALGRLPRRVVLVGIPALEFDYGTRLSPPVAAAVEPAVAEVARLVREHEGATP